MDLVVTGNLRDHDEQADIELWRRPFLGWGHQHVMLAETRCRPRRYALVDMGVERASGPTIDSLVEAGEIFSLTL